MKTNNPMIDSGKRHTLKRLIATAGATTTLAALPSFSNANWKNEKNSTHLSQANREAGNQIGGYVASSEIVIAATLVSILGTTRETLLLKNLTDKPLTIEHFEQASVTFDGETLDCNMVCDRRSIIVPTNKDVMAHFSSLPIEHQSSHSLKAFNVQAVVSRLPEGTRVIPLNFTMRGTTAALLTA